MRVSSSFPSPFGLKVKREAVTFCSASAAAFPPRVPVTGRTVGPASIRHEYEPGAASVASQVKSTAVPEPAPPATTVPAASVTLTVHGRAAESLAVNRIGDPIAPRTTGEYSFGPPKVAASRAMAGSAP